MTLRGDLVPPAVMLQLPKLPVGCTCSPEYFPQMSDADCPEHGLRALIEGRFVIEDARS